MSTQRLSRIAILAALCIVSRYVFGMFPNIKPITAIFLIVCTFWGFGDSLLVMSICMCLTGFLFGFGPWVFFQLISYLAVLFIWVAFQRIMTKSRGFGIIKIVEIETIMASCVAFLYGLMIDSVSAMFYHMPWWTYVINGSSFNLAHAVSTFLFYPIIYFIFRRFQNEKII